MTLKNTQTVAEVEVDGRTYRAFAEFSADQDPESGIVESASICLEPSGGKTIKINFPYVPFQGAVNTLQRDAQLRMQELQKKAQEKARQLAAERAAKTGDQAS